MIRRHHQRHVYARFRRYLQAAILASTGVHILRHTAARLRHDACESVELVSAFLDHSSLAVTTVSVRRLATLLEIGLAAPATVGRRIASR